MDRSQDQPVPAYPFVEQQRALGRAAIGAGLLLCVALAAVAGAWWLAVLYVALLLVVIAPTAWVIGRLAPLHHLDAVEETASGPDDDRTAAARRSGYTQALGAVAAVVLLTVVYSLASDDLSLVAPGVVFGLGAASLFQARRFKAWEGQRGQRLFVRADAPRYAFGKAAAARRLVAVPVHALDPEQQ